MHGVLIKLGSVTVHEAHVSLPCLHDECSRRLHKGGIALQSTNAGKTHFANARGRVYLCFVLNHAVHSAESGLATVNFAA